MQSYVFLTQSLPAQPGWQKFILGVKKTWLIGLSYLMGIPGVNQVVEKFFIGHCAKICFLKRKGDIHEALENILLLLQKPISEEQTWYLLKWGVTLAQESQLNPDYRLLQEMDRLSDRLKLIKSDPKGYDAAYVYICLALWAMQKSDMEMAVQYVTIAIRADETWGYSYFLMGWIACFNNMMDPVPYFIEAILKDWTYFQRIQRDPVLQQYPEVLRDIRQQLQIVNINKKSKRFFGHKI